MAHADANRRVYYIGNMISNTRVWKGLPALIAIVLIITLTACNTNEVFGGGGSNDNGNGVAATCGPASAGGFAGGSTTVGVAELGAPVGNWDSSVYQKVGFATGNETVHVTGDYAGGDVLYVISNAGEVEGEEEEPPVVTVPGTGHNEPTSVSVSAARSGVAAGGAAGRGDYPIVYRGHPEITAQNAELAAGLGTASTGVTSRTVTPSTYAVGDTDQFNCFYLDGNLIERSQPDEQLTATLKWNVLDSVSEWRVLVWVDNAWLDEEGPRITDEMIEYLARNFIKNDDDQDIFGWVTSVFGKPWGAPQYSNTVSSGTRDIHILLHDIDGLGVPDGTPQGRYAGLFWSGDNFLRGTASGEVASSNERLMFYLNAGLLVGSDQGEWNPEGFWPREIVSTLAHEFQHMIQFYQRSVRRGSSAVYATWLDELASLMAEDLVADKLGIPGPRGVVGPGPGGSGNTGGRIPLYNAAGAGTQLTSWASGSDSLAHYSTSYTFGAYLARVYGVGYLKELLQEIPVVVPDDQEDGDYERWAVAEAVRRATGTEVNFAELLRRWGIAMLVSNDTAVPAPVSINDNGWFTDTVEGQQYRLGSINAYNYRFQTSEGTYNGPSIWSLGTAPVPSAANRFVYAGEVPSDGVTLDFSLPDDVSVTVLVREDG